MKYGFVRVGAVSPDIKIANCKYNADQIILSMDKTKENGCDILVFPELSITGYTCGDLFLQDQLLKSAARELVRIKKHSEGIRCVFIVGIPIAIGGNIYNTAAVIYDGKIYGLIPKQNIPNYNEFYEMRYFTPFAEDNRIHTVEIDSECVPMGNILFKFGTGNGQISFGVEICEDLWAQDSPSRKLVTNGALIICNLSASNEIVGKSEYRKILAAAHSGKNICAYIYSDAGTYESTSDVVFSGHKFIYENSSLLAESELFNSDEILLADVDTELLLSERKAISTFIETHDIVPVFIPFTPKDHEDTLRSYKKFPFVPQDETQREKRCAEIINIQAHGLKRRLLHTHAKIAVLGLSGGLDSTLALLVTARAFDLAGMERKNIHCITMPCFGTTYRTYNNACKLCSEIGASLTEIDIKESVLRHFKDIGQDPSIHDVTYENSQARERTQILMDYANKNNGLVIGTGDLSELALGWATYNGDHMSMYGVNASIPKTLVRSLVKYYADVSEGMLLKDVLYDILDTPVSPELLPPENGKIFQKTEDLVGPYELHDFFLYYFKRFGFTPKKIYFAAKQAFSDTYSDEIILKWLKTFLKRFFTQQFKRSCMPDGPKVGTVALSPRGDLRMPSDADSSEWLTEFES